MIKQLGLDKNAAFAGKTGLGDPLASLWAMVNSWIPSNVRSNSPRDPSGVDSRLIDAYAGALEVEPVKRSRLVNVAVSTPDPSLSANIANAHANAFIRQGLKLRSRANEDAKKFLETKLAFRSMIRKISSSIAWRILTNVSRRPRLNGSGWNHRPD